MLGLLTEKPLICLCILAVLISFVFLSSLGLGRYFSFTYDSFSSQYSFLNHSKTYSGECEIPLRVYMYDLPRRFNLGMLKRNSSNQNLPWNDSRIPAWPNRSGLKKQHSVEYWMMIYLLVNNNRQDGEMAAIRVYDPEQADVFFVPFFASLSFNTHGRVMTDPETEIDRQLQMEIVDTLKKSKAWQHSQGHDHVIVMHHPNAFRFLRDEVNSSIFIVADFGRYPPTLSNLRKDVVAPYVHVVDTFLDDEGLDPFEARKTLLYFRGRIRRKDEGIVRLQLANMYNNHEGVRFEDSVASTEGFELSTKGMRASRFCLHPAGDTPSSCRLFDAIVSHCVPVIISDRIELPFEDVIDYQEFSLFFSVKEALRPGYLIEQLEKFPRERWINMWTKLKEVSHVFEYQYPPKPGDAVNMIWKEVQRKLPTINLAKHRTKRLKIPDWWSKR